MRRTFEQWNGCDPKVSAVGGEPMWKEVTHDEFFRVIGQQDVSPVAVGRWPYTSEWKTRNRRVIGKTVDYLPEGEGLTKTRYLLPDENA